MKNRYSKHTYSVLENGNAIFGKLKIGSYFPTQWGPRRVVKHIQLTHDHGRDVPPGC